MKTMQEELEELLSLSGDQFEEKLQWLKQNRNSEEEKRILTAALMGEMEETKKDIDNIREALAVKEQLKKELEILPLSYIAENYFGKTRAWLYQRLNGNKRRGKVYTFNEKEIEIFNRALKDISNRIGSLSIKL